MDRFGPFSHRFFVLFIVFVVVTLFSEKIEKNVQKHSKQFQKIMKKIVCGLFFSADGMAIAMAMASF